MAAKAIVCFGAVDLCYNENIIMNNEILKNEDLSSQEDKFGLDFWEKIKKR